MKRLFFIFVLFLAGFSGFAQKESNTWYFGINAGIDFSGGSPIAIINGQVNTNEGCSSISDSLGNLLFYTDGVTVWNSNHDTMPNGFGLLGDVSSSQSALIVPKPGSSNTYFIFAVDNGALIDGLTYSEIDMMLDGGLGDITVNKNIQLVAPTTEKLTAIRHCNDTDIWVVTNDFITGAFNSFLVTSSGVNFTPVVSSVGNNGYAGCLKASRDGAKIAAATWNPGIFELYDFDNCVGTVSNPIFSVSSNAAYGVEFSPDGSKLYVSSWGVGTIYQYDLQSGDSATIVNSANIIGTSTTTILGSLQLGLDGKIYAARPTAEYLAIINDPNTYGAPCDFVDDGLYLAGKTCWAGLPNFLPLDTLFLSTVIEELSTTDNQMTVYPNPTTGIFTLQGAKGEIQVYDLFGRLVLSTNNAQVDMSSYPAGLYIWSTGTARGKVVIN